MSTAIGVGRLCAAIGVTALAILVAGCAVQKTHRGYEIGIDKAALMGSELAAFKLRDGSSGTLRSYARDQRSPEFSVKLEKYQKVIELGTAERMRFERADAVGDRTLVVITRYERDCVRTSLLALKDSEVLAWTLNHQDCRSEPVPSVEGDRLYLSYGPVRFVYQAGNVTKQSAPLPQPSAASRPASVDPRLPVPAPKLGANAGVLSADTPTPRSPATRPTKVERRPPASPAPAASTRPLDFPQEQQKPVRIILD